MKLFAKQSFHTTSISQIAEAANVSKGLMYNYFKSKEALLLAIIHQASEEIFDVADHLSSRSNYQKTLRHFLDQYFLFLKANKSYISFQLGLFFQPDLKKIVEAPLQKRADHLLSLTEAMFREAGIDDPNSTARRFMTELDGIAFHFLAVFKNFPLERMQENLFNNYKRLQK